MFVGEACMPQLHTPPADVGNHYIHTHVYSRYDCAAFLLFVSFCRAFCLVGFSFFGGTCGLSACSSFSSSCMRRKSTASVRAASGLVTVVLDENDGVVVVAKHSPKLRHKRCSGGTANLSSNLPHKWGTIGCNTIPQTRNVSIVMAIIVSSRSKFSIFCVFAASVAPLLAVTVAAGRFSSHGRVVSKKLLAACKVDITVSTTK